MTGPVKVSGNGDDLLDPGEVWAYQYPATLWQNSFLSVWISGAPEHEPLGGIVSTPESDLVTVIPTPPSPSPTPSLLPFTGVEVMTVALIGLLSLSTGLSLRRFVTRSGPETDSTPTR